MPVVIEPWYFGKPRGRLFHLANTSLAKWKRRPLGLPKYQGSIPTGYVNPRRESFAAGSVGGRHPVIPPGEDSCFVET